MEVYLNGQVPVQFPDNATENDVAAFFQGQKARGGGVWDNAFQIAGMLGQQQQPQAPTVAGQFPVFGNAVGLSQEQFEGLNRTFMGVGQQQLQQQQLQQQEQQYNASRAMQERAMTQRELQAEKDRAQQLKLEQQRFKNDQQMEQLRLEREQQMFEMKMNRESEDKKAELERGTVASGVGGQQLVRRINPQTGQWEVLPLNEPIFAPRGGGRGGGASGIEYSGGYKWIKDDTAPGGWRKLGDGASGMEYSGGYKWIKDDTAPGGWRKLGDTVGGDLLPGEYEVKGTISDPMGNVKYYDKYGNEWEAGQNPLYNEIAPQQPAVSAATDTPPPATAGGGLNLGTGKETGASAAVKAAQAGTGTATPKQASIPPAYYSEQPYMERYTPKRRTQSEYFELSGPGIAERIGGLLGSIRTDSNPGLEPGYTPKAKAPAIPPKLTPEQLDALMQPKSVQGDMTTKSDSVLIDGKPYKMVIPEGSTTLIDGKPYKMVNGEWRPVNAK